MPDATRCKALPCWSWLPGRSHHQAQGAALLDHVSLLDTDVLEGAVAGGHHSILHLHCLQHNLQAEFGQNGVEG